MKQIIVHTKGQPLKISADALHDLSEYLHTSITDYFARRVPLDSQWREDLRIYEGVPLRDVSNFPIENAPNIEITLGAIACDSIYAQAIDSLFAVTPFITCRPMPNAPSDDESVKDAKAMQRFVNWSVRNEMKLREAADEFILDDVQLGTGNLYIPWVEFIKKTKSAKIITQHPVVRTIPVEDCIFIGVASSDLDDLLILGYRFWLTKEEVVQRGNKNNWDMEHVEAAGARDWVRERREALGRQRETFRYNAALYDVYDLYVYYDIDGDGIPEDLYITYNHTGRKIMKIVYNPFDRRPGETAVYQRRAHLFHGMGVLHMLKPFQQEMSDLHNYQVLNALLANTRLWFTREGVVPDNLVIYPNRQIQCQDPKDDVNDVALADVYPSIMQIQMVLMQLAERRTGANEMSMPSQSNVMGNRTPGITALSLLQQANKRFAPAFADMRRALGNAARQGLYRYQEKLLAGSVKVENHIITVLGEEDGERVIRVLKNKHFDENMVVELTASTATVNAEADKQNALMLVNILAQYYERTLQLVGIASNPETPEPVREVARKVANSAGEIMDRTIRTFDQVRDPISFIIDINTELDKIQEQATPEATGGLLQLIQGGADQQSLMNAGGMM